MPFIESILFCNILPLFQPSADRLALKTDSPPSASIRARLLPKTMSGSFFSARVLRTLAMNPPMLSIAFGFLPATKRV